VESYEDKGTFVYTLLRRQSVTTTGEVKKIMCEIKCLEFFIIIIIMCTILFCV